MTYSDKSFKSYGFVFLRFIVYPIFTQSSITLNSKGKFAVLRKVTKKSRESNKLYLHAKALNLISRVYNSINSCSYFTLRVRNMDPK